MLKQALAILNVFEEPISTDAEAPVNPHRHRVAQSRMTHFKKHFCLTSGVEGRVCISRKKGVMSLHNLFNDSASVQYVAC